MSNDIVYLHLPNIEKSSPGGEGGGGVAPYIGYIGMCRCEEYGFQTVDLDRVSVSKELINWLKILV